MNQFRYFQSYLRSVSVDFDQKEICSFIFKTDYYY